MFNKIKDKINKVRNKCNRKLYAEGTLASIQNGLDTLYLGKSEGKNGLVYITLEHNGPKLDMARLVIFYNENSFASSTYDELSVIVEANWMFKYIDLGPFEIKDGKIIYDIEKV